MAVVVVDVVDVVDVFDPSSFSPLLFIAASFFVLRTRTVRKNRNVGSISDGPWFDLEFKPEAQTR